MADGNDLQMKRLDHLQGIVQRLAGNSFLIKGWAVTLVSAVLGFALKDATTSPLAYLAIVPVLLFWGLDAYYLAVERGVRKLYNDGAVAVQAALAPAAPAAVIAALPAANIAPAKVCFGRWFSAAKTPATCVIYLLLVFCILAVGTGWFLQVAKAIVVYI
jgi:hypothetical protein